MHRMQDFWTHYNKGYRWDPVTSAIINIGIPSINVHIPILSTETNNYGHFIDSILFWIYGKDAPDNDSDGFKKANDVTLEKENEWLENCCKNKDGEWIVRPKEK